MNRRIATYPADMEALNVVASLGGFFLAAGFLVFLANIVVSWVRGSAASADPWRARTLEWQTSSPPPVENFETAPEVVGGPYDYGTPDAVHATFGPGQGMGVGDTAITHTPHNSRAINSMGLWLFIAS